MRFGRISLLLAIVGVAIAGGCSPQADPQIRLSSEKVPRHWKVEVTGSGFTPTHNVSSHLRRSDGSEFPVLPILSDARGAVSHTIDSMVLESGPHELWVVDDQSGRTSNHVTFDVTYDY
jgi:hypothetical protein